MKIYLTLVICLGFLVDVKAQETEHLKYKIGKTSVTFEKTDFGENPRVLFFNMHEDESTSVVSAKPVLSQGGSFRLIALRHSGKRNLVFTRKGITYAVDPNRIYTKEGAKITVERNSEKFSPYAVRKALKFSGKVRKKFVDKADYIVALHNNTPDNYSVLGYLPGGPDVPDVEDIYVNDTNDHDDFFYTTDKDFHEFAKSRGFNTVLQKPGLVRDDGSLSVYCGVKGKLYINIEAEHGHVEMQQKMTEVVVEYLKKRYE